MSGTPHEDRSAPRRETRREFLKAAGKVALVAPPAMSMIMAAASKPAHAGSRYNNNTKKKFSFFSWLIKVR